MYLHLSSSLKYPWKEARTTCKSYHRNFTRSRAVEWLLHYLQLHRLQHHHPHCSPLTVLLLADGLTCSHLVLGSEDSKTNSVWFLTGWPCRQTCSTWREWCLGGGRWAELIWPDLGSREDFLWRRCYLSCSELWHLSLLLWRLCEFLLGFPVSFMDPSPGHFPQNCGVTHFVAQLTPLVATHSLSTGKVWTPQHACGTDPSSPPPQPGSTCISPKCFCSLLGLFLCLGSWPMCTPYLMGTCLFVNAWLKSHLFYETSFNSIFPFRITDLLL